MHFLVLCCARKEVANQIVDSSRKNQTPGSTKKSSSEKQKEIESNGSSTRKPEPTKSNPESTSQSSKTSTTSTSATTVQENVKSTSGKGLVKAPRDSRSRVIPDKPSTSSTANGFVRESMRVDGTPPNPSSTSPRAQIKPISDPTSSQDVSTVHLLIIACRCRSHV